MQTDAPRVGHRLIRFALKGIATAGLVAACMTAWADDVQDVQKLLAAGKNADAIQKADTYLAGKPRDAMMRFLRGIGLSQSGRTQDAISAFTKLTEDYPELPEPFNNLAVLYAQQGQYDKARNSLEMAIRTNPSYATAYENLGDVYAKLASQAYSRALQIDTRSQVAPKLAMIRDLFPKDRAIQAAATGSPMPPAAAQPSTTAVVTSASSSTLSGAAGATPAPAPAPTKPAAVPETHVRPAEPKPEAKPAPSSEDEAREHDVAAAVRAWAEAWSKKDMEAYFAAYAREFNPGKPRKAWEEERRARILSKGSISVHVNGLHVTVSGNRAVAQFHQEYHAGALNVSSAKHLDLVRSGGTWLIVKESTGS